MVTEPSSDLLKESISITAAKVQVYSHSFNLFTLFFIILARWNDNYSQISFAQFPLQFQRNKCNAKSFVEFEIDRRSSLGPKTKYQATLTFDLKSKLVHLL